MSILVSGVGLLWMQRQLETALAVRPPVVVLDLAGAARETDPAQLAALLDAYRTTAERLAGRGLLVLERQAVLAAPAGLTLIGSGGAACDALSRLPSDGARSSGRGWRIRPIRWRSRRVALVVCRCCCSRCWPARSMAAARYRLGIDTQARVSLAPYRVFLVDTWQGPGDIVQGDLVAFRAAGARALVPDGQLLIKQAAGVPGDWVSVDRPRTPDQWHAHGRWAGVGGDPAADPATFVRHERVPVEHFWMLGESADSFDSRYWGFLPMTRMMGKAYVLF